MRSSGVPVHRIFLKMSLRSNWMGRTVRLTKSLRLPGVKVQSVLHALTFSPAAADTLKFATTSYVTGSLKMPFNLSIFLLKIILRTLLLSRSLFPLIFLFFRV